MKSSFGLYLHIPYCLRKCPYCDFNSYGIEGAESRMDEHGYRTALMRELEVHAEHPDWSARQIHSIFFGGGTPSLFSAESFSYFLAEIQRLFPLVAEAEVTMETNPGTVQEDLGEDKLKAIRETGVNRISLGVQSFSERKRKLLGRWHSTEEIIRAIENIRGAGFSNYSFDFIFGTPEETPEEWADDLQRAISFSPRHISAYGLTIEPGTEFGRLHRKGLFEELDEGVQAEMYEMCGSVLRENGYERYEISNYAQQGFECRHNLGYWQSEDYLGLGAGAHSFIGHGEGAARSSIRWVNYPRPEHYVKQISLSGSAKQREESLNLEQQRIEYFFLRLRTSRGVSVSEFEERFEEPFQSRYADTAKKLHDSGLLVCEDDGIRLSERGFLFSNTVFEAFAEKS